MNVLFFSTVFLAVIATALADAEDPNMLRCFQCNSKQDESCSDEFRPSSKSLTDAYLKPCPVKDGIQPFCRKGKYWVDSKIRDSEIYVNRDCGYMKKELKEDVNCYRSRAEDHVTDICTCDDRDGCNGSQTLQLAGPFAMLFAIVFARTL